MKNWTVLYVALASILFGGCTMPIQRHESRFVSVENVKKKNYSIGTALVASVGEPMIKFQDFWLTTSEKPVAMIDRKITIKGGPVEINMTPGKRYPVVGSLTDEGVAYSLVHADSPNLVMVGPDGSIRNRVAALHDASEVVQVVWVMQISDPKAIVSFEKFVQVDTQKGYENFELLYTGVSSGSINMTYREFSPDGLARVAFFQNLTYPVSSKNISFKKYRIQINSATADGIDFKVLEDGR